MSFAGTRMRTGEVLEISTDPACAKAAQPMMAVARVKQRAGRHLTNIRIVFIRLFGRTPLRFVAFFAGEDKRGMRKGTFLAAPHCQQARSGGGHPADELDLFQLA